MAPPRSWGAVASLWLPWLGLSLGGCGGSSKDNTGVVVRQVLRGAEATAADPAPPSAAAQTGAGASALVQAVAPSGSTLVADTPQAVYRRALEQARRPDDELSLRQRLAAIEAKMDHEQEEEQ